MKNWTIRRYRPNDEKQITQLFQDVFRKPMGITESIKHWEWEYKKNLYDRLEILLAIDGNKIIGHYVVIPIKMKIGKKEYIASLSLDTMTHKNYRGQGIFPILAAKLYDDLGKTGIPITYGFPNAYSINGLIKNNWFEISNIPICVRPLNFIHLFNRYLKNKHLSTFLGTITNLFYNMFLKKNKMPNNVKIKEIKEFNKNFDTLWELSKKEIIIGIIRDSKYLNWRYFQKPEENYVVYAINHNGQLKGYIVLKVEERFGIRTGLIMDILTEPSNIKYQNYLIKDAILYFKNKKVDIISAMMFPHWIYYKTLKKQWFIRIPKMFLPGNMCFCARINNSEINIQLIKNPNNWYLTWGDTDVI